LRRTWRVRDQCGFLKAQLISRVLLGSVLLVRAFTLGPRAAPLRNMVQLSAQHQTEARGNPCRVAVVRSACKLCGWQPSSSRRSWSSRVGRSVRCMIFRLCRRKIVSSRLPSMQRDRAASAMTWCRPLQDQRVLMMYPTVALQFPPPQSHSLSSCHCQVRTRRLAREHLP